MLVCLPLNRSLFAFMGLDLARQKRPDALQFAELFNTTKKAFHRMVDGMFQFCAPCVSADTL
jgi:hypothetical protein